MPDSLSTTLAALADPTRRAILARLATGEATVKELAAPFRMSGPAVSKHQRIASRCTCSAFSQFSPRKKFSRT